MKFYAVYDISQIWPKGMLEGVWLLAQSLAAKQREDALRAVQEEAAKTGKVKEAALAKLRAVEKERQDMEAANEDLRWLCTSICMRWHANIACMRELQISWRHTAAASTCTRSDKSQGSCGGANVRSPLTFQSCAKPGMRRMLSCERLGAAKLSW